MKYYSSKKDTVKKVSLIDELKLISVIIWLLQRAPGVILD